MVRLLVSNVNTEISGLLHPDVKHNSTYHDAVSKELSYKVPSAEFSPKYKAGIWDGTISLYKKSTRTFPTGLISRVIKILKILGVTYSVVDQRVRPLPNIRLTTAFKEHGREIRFYQEEASKRAHKFSRGVLAIGTGGGKTILACDLLERMGVAPFIFIVPSISLLRQTHNEFKKYLRVGDVAPEIGFIGAGICDISPEGINVGTYQSLFASFNLAFDEKTNKVSHDLLAGEKIKKPTEALLKEHESARKHFRLEHNRALADWSSPAQGTAFQKHYRKRLKSAKESLRKAKSACVSRKRSLDQKGRIRALLSSCKGFIIDEAHIAASVTEALAQNMPQAFYRHGLSVGADSIVELRGGAFGTGWVGEIESAWDVVVSSGAVPRQEQGGYEIACLDNSVIETRGWGDDGFIWKPIKNFIRHNCNKTASAIKVAGDTLCITDDHSVFRVEPDGFVLRHNKKKPIPKFQERPTSELATGDILAADNGSNWGGSASQFDALSAVSKSVNCARKVRISVDMSTVTRHDVGLNSKIWWQCRNVSRYGHSLSLEQYLVCKDKLPEPTRMYCESSNGTYLLPNINLQSWAFVLGFWLGDGWLGDGRVSFAVESSALTLFTEEIGKLEGVACTVRSKKMTGNSYEVHLYSSLVRAMFHSIFGHVKCYEKSIPGDWIVSWSREARLELLRGLIASDGSTTMDSAYAYTTTSQSLARTILSLMRSLGVRAGISKSAAAEGGCVNGRQIIGRRPKYQVFWGEHALDANHVGKFGHRFHYHQDKIRFLESRIRKKSPISIDGYVYDLEMHGHPSFVANGVLVHNSATPYRQDNQEIRIEGTLGRILIEISASDLIDLGYTVPANIFMMGINSNESPPEPGKKKVKRPYPEVYREYVTDCWERNWRIKQCAEAFKIEGMPTIILVEKIEHGHILEDMIENSVFVPGSDKGEDDPDDAERDYRRRMLNKCGANEIILIATSWANVGIDEARLQVLIRGGTEQSPSTVYQQVGRVARCLGSDYAESCANGKHEMIVIDPLDSQSDLRSHANNRLKVYRNERGWKVRIVR